MRWQTVKKLNPAQFKRLVGVKYETFEKMVSEAKRIKALQPKKIAGKKRGPKEKTNWYDKTLMMLMYYREYRTFAHVGATYNISETQCWRIVTTMERWLIKSKLFHLPGKKKLTQSDVEWDVVVVDVSEHPIERPKKNSENIIQEKRKNIP
jgi:Helix-turn-helix of DDE superfamily endonuclease